MDPKPKLILLAKSSSNLPKLLVLMDYCFARGTGE
jgi:hypothetical protein